MKKQNQMSSFRLWYVLRPQKLFTFLYSTTAVHHFILLSIKMYSLCCVWLKESVELGEVDLLVGEYIFSCGKE